MHYQIICFRGDYFVRKFEFQKIKNPILGLNKVFIIKFLTFPPIDYPKYWYHKVSRVLYDLKCLVGVPTLPVFGQESIFVKPISPSLGEV